MERKGIERIGSIQEPGRGIGRSTQIFFDDRRIRKRRGGYLFLGRRRGFQGDDVLDIRNHLGRSRDELLGESLEREGKERERYKCCR